MDDDDSEDDGIELDELRALDKGKEISEEKEEDGETDWEAVWRGEAGRLGERAVNELHASLKKAKKTRKLTDLEGRMYRMAAENISKLADAKGSFLKTAAVEIADIAEKKIGKYRKMH